MTSVVHQGTVTANEVLALQTVELQQLSVVFLAGGGGGFLCPELGQRPLPHLGDWKRLMACKYFHLLVGIVAAGTDEPAGVAERCGFRIRAILTGNFVALRLFHNVTDLNEAIDEEHRWKGAGVVPSHGANAAALGTLHLLVPLLSQEQLLDALSAVHVEAGQGLGIAVGLQAYGTLQLLL